MIYEVRTPGYNYIFNGANGRHIRWGFDAHDDPQWSPIGPEILDIEVSTACHGGCQFCYKGNTPAGQNMSLATFQTILSNMPMLTQIAFGIGDLRANPDLFDMIRLTREYGIVPNLTINGHELDEGEAEFLADHCGAIAVSLYDPDHTYRAVEMLSGAGLQQVNIHALVSRETMPLIEGLLIDRRDPRLEGLNAVVFLSLKQRGRGMGHTPLTGEEYAALVKRVQESGIRFGFDSCSAHKFLASVENPEQYAMYAEPCEGACFSSYINVEGMFYPCSFNENGEGLDVVHCRDFLEDIWYHPQTIAWRRHLIAGGRKCPTYTI